MLYLYTKHQDREEERKKRDRECRKQEKEETEELIRVKRRIEELQRDVELAQKKFISFFNEKFQFYFDLEDYQFGVNYYIDGEDYCDFYFKALRVDMNQRSYFVPELGPLRIELQRTEKFLISYKYEMSTYGHGKGILKEYHSFASRRK